MTRVAKFQADDKGQARFAHCYNVLLTGIVVGIQGRKRSYAQVQEDGRILDAFEQISVPKQGEMTATGEEMRVLDMGGSCTLLLSEADHRAALERMQEGATQIRGGLIRDVLDAMAFFSSAAIVDPKAEREPARFKAAD